MLIFKEDQLAQVKDDAEFLKLEMESAIKELPENYRTARKKLREEYQPQISQLNKQSLDLKQEIGDLKIALVETGVDVGPAIYLARVFDTEIDTVVKWFILILIFVFDPLAVSLVIAANVAFEQASGVVTKPRKNKKRWWEMYKEKKEDIQVINKNDEISEEKETEKKEEVTRGGIDLS
tara:strand:- start:842 stop:1378 length:537 start_codon:yes stop_codon:yes gene_type:complete